MAFHDDKGDFSSSFQSVAHFSPRPPYKRRLADFRFVLPRKFFNLYFLPIYLLYEILGRKIVKTMSGTFRRGITYLVRHHVCLEAIHTEAPGSLSLPY